MDASSSSEPDNQLASELFEGSACSDLPLLLDSSITSLSSPFSLSLCPVINVTSKLVTLTKHSRHRHLATVQGYPTVTGFLAITKTATQEHKRAGEATKLINLRKMVY